MYNRGEDYSSPLFFLFKDYTMAIANNGPRRRALERYYEDPNYCLQCGGMIVVRDNERPVEVRKKKFCDRKCKALYSSKKGNVKLNNKVREEALKEYYKNPNRCINCGKVMEIKPHQNIHDVTRKKFCGSSCSATFNGLQRGSVLVRCLNCGNEFERNVNDTGSRLKRSESKYCEKCQGSRTNSISKRTKAELARDRASKYSTRNAIAEDAQNVYRNSGKQYKCLLCDFPIIEICHVKPVSDFPEDTAIKVINDIGNLIPLCPKHHAEWDRDIMDKEDVAKIKEILNG